MTDVESDEFRKARKQRYREAMRAGTEATLEKGRVMDGVHNERVIVEHVKSTAEILHEAVEIAKEIALEVLLEREREVGESNIPIHIDVVDEKEEVVDSVDADIPVSVDEEGVVHADVNETISELEQLSARIAQLERELKEKENSTD